MSDERETTYPIADRQSYLWSAIGTALSLFSTRKWTIRLVAWLVSVFTIRFVRTQKPSRGVILAWLGAYLTSLVAW